MRHCRRRTQQGPPDRTPGGVALRVGPVRGGLNQPDSASLLHLEAGGFKVACQLLEGSFDGRLLAVLHGDQLLGAVFGGSDEHQQAQSSILHASVAADAIGPRVHIAPTVLLDLTSRCNYIKTSSVIKIHREMFETASSSSLLLPLLPADGLVPSCPHRA